MKFVNNGVVQTGGHMHIEHTVIGNHATVNEPAEPSSPSDDDAGTNTVSGDIDGNAVQIGTVQGDLNITRRGTSEAPPA